MWPSGLVDQAAAAGGGQVMRLRRTVQESLDWVVHGC
jgi:hypothetical protein